MIILKRLILGCVLLLTATASQLTWAFENKCFSIEMTAPLVDDLQYRSSFAKDRCKVYFYDLWGHGSMEVFVLANEKGYSPELKDRLIAVIVDDWNHRGKESASTQYVEDGDYYHLIAQPVDKKDPFEARLLFRGKWVIIGTADGLEGVKGLKGVNSVKVKL